LPGAFFLHVPDLLLRRGDRRIRRDRRGVQAGDAEAGGGPHRDVFRVAVHRARDHVRRDAPSVGRRAAAACARAGRRGGGVGAMVAVAVPAPQPRIEQVFVRSEPWLPLLIGVAWWAAMYPGLFGEDSLMNLTEPRDGPVSVWFTAWWIYVIRFVTLGTRAIPLLTLFGVLTLTFAVRYWAAALFPHGASRALAICLVCASPLVGALGIQVRHDIEMTA